MGRKLKIGDYVHGSIYAGDHNGHHVFCSLKEYESPVRLNWHDANEYCQELEMTLPTKEELNLLYELSRLVPDQFRTSSRSLYWSSTERSSTAACFQYFGDGTQIISNKTYGSHVRPIKRIKISEYRALT